MRGWVGLAALLALAVSARGSGQALQDAGHYRQQTWQSDSGLPQNTVHAVLQTRDGFLWLATEGGLVRFDGLNFKVWDTANTPELHTDLVDALVEDGAGALWAGTSDGLLRLKDGYLRAFRVEDGLPSNVVMGVYRQRNGTVAALTAAGLAVVEGERFRTIAGTAALGDAANAAAVVDSGAGELWAAAGSRLYAVASGAQAAYPPFDAQVGTIHALAAAENGAVWAGGTGGLRCWRRTNPCSPLLLGEENVSALAADSQSSGALWIGTAKGLSRWSGGVLHALDAPSSLGAVQSLLADRAGGVWVAFDRGLARAHRDRVQEISASSGTGDLVLAMFEDREGDLWMGSEGNGLTVLRDQPFSTLTTQQGLSADFVRTIFQDRAGTVLVGTDKGGLDTVAAGRAKPFPVAGGLASGVILALAQTGEDLWVGTPDGLTRIRAGRVQSFTGDDGLPDNFVRSLFADRDGTLWIGTRNGLVHEADEKFTTYTTRDGLGSDAIGSVLRTRDGVLWVGTLAGLSRLDGTRFRNFTTRAGLAGDAVTVLFEDDQGTLWAGTNGSGLTRIRPSKFTPIDSVQAGLPQTVYDMVEDGSGHLWMCSKQGIYRVAASALNAFADRPTGALPVDRFGAADGMRIGECSGGGYPAAWRMRDGTLWFATVKGVAFIDPRSVVEAPPPPVAVERVLLDGREAQRGPDGWGGAGLVVPAGQSRIAIEYAGLSFAAPQKVRYRYRLEGFDRGWVEAGAGRTAFYTNVPPGRYRFLVEASAMEGVWSAAPAEIVLNIRPRFFQTWWFYVLLAGALLLLVYLIYRLRVRFVEARLNGVMAERGRIAREIHDTLAQGYVGISVQLEIASQLLGHSEAATRAQLEETKALVQSGLAEARSSIWELRSQGAGADSLPARLAALAKRTRRGPLPEITVDVHGIYRPLPGKVEDELLRIAQEGVQNALRHAAASRIAISLTYDAKRLAMRVTDDGVGFDRAAVQTFTERGHFGLAGMRERAAAVGAVLDVQSEAGHGTTLTVRVNANSNANVNPEKEI